VNLLIKVLIVSCLFYSVLAIILTTNYDYFMELIGNEMSSQYQKQTRASMMIGSSITVSNYLNLTLLICFYYYYHNKSKKWIYITFGTIIFNIMATLLLLSRLASLIAIITAIIYIAFFKPRKNKRRLKFLIICSGVIAIIYSYYKYDLSRILNGFGSSGATIEGRFDSAILGWNVFKDYPLFGSGMGRFFERVYDYRYIEYDGLTGLIDPHNMY